MPAVRAGDAGEEEPDDVHVVDEEFREVVVRRSPRYGRFLVLGVVGGLILAGVLTAIVSAGGGPGGLDTGAGGALRTFGTVALVCVAAGLLVSGLLAIVLDRWTSRRAHPATADHTTALTDDLAHPVTDETPTWVRDEDDLR